MLSTSSSIQDKSFQETCNFIITLLHVVLKEKQTVLHVPLTRVSNPDVKNLELVSRQELCLVLHEDYQYVSKGRY